MKKARVGENPVKTEMLSDISEVINVYQRYEEELWKHSVTSEQTSTKRHRSTYSEADTEKVLQFLRIPSTSVRQASDLFHIPKSTIKCVCE